MKASDLFVKALEHEGVEFVFGIPGEENLDLLESLRHSQQIRLVLTRQIRRELRCARSPGAVG